MTTDQVRIVASTPGGSGRQIEVHSYARDIDDPDLPALIDQLLGRNFDLQLCRRAAP